MREVVSSNLAVPTISKKLPGCKGPGGFLIIYQVHDHQNYLFVSYSLETLEFTRLLELVSRHAQTPMGTARLARLRPLENRRELNDALAAIIETIVLNEEKQASWSFSDLDDPSAAIAVLKIKNASLEPNRMLEIARVCSQALFARSSIQPEKEFVPTLWQIVESIPPTLFAAIEKIGKKLLPSGEIDD